MKTYKVTFTPAGAYFFGNEKTFKYPGQNIGNFFGKLYFIRGEAIPSQTTLLGALRYLALPENLRGFDKIGSPETKQYVGEKSFDLDSDQSLTFGAIHSLSPLFLCQGNDYLIPTPRDHNKAQSDCYRPFLHYSNAEIPPDGRKILYTEEYDCKEGLTSSWMHLNDGKLESEKDLFKADTRVGIDTVHRKNAYFKKEYRTLKEGFSFAIYAKLDDTVFQPDPNRQYTVTLGQGKSPFAVRFTEEDNHIGDLVIALIRKQHKGMTLAPTGEQPDQKLPAAVNFVYCWGDCLISAKPQADFSAVQTKDYRAYRTQQGGRVEKDSRLHKLIRAGSVFIFRDQPTGDYFTKTVQQKNACAAGMNRVISISITIGGKQ